MSRFGLVGSKTPFKLFTVRDVSDDLLHGFIQLRRHRNSHLLTGRSLPRLQRVTLRQGLVG